MKIPVNRTTLDGIGNVHTDMEVPLSCVVCGHWYGSNFHVSYPHDAPIVSTILKDNVVRVGDYYYVLPKHHKRCRELFHLSPIEYVLL